MYPSSSPLISWPCHTSHPSTRHLAGGHARRVLSRRDSRSRESRDTEDPGQHVAHAPTKNLEVAARRTRGPRTSAFDFKPGSLPSPSTSSPSISPTPTIYLIISSPASPSSLSPPVGRAPQGFNHHQAEKGRRFYPKTRRNQRGDILLPCRPSERAAAPVVVVVVVVAMETGGHI